jgi:Domain of Unknown Function (DUF1080)
MRGKIMRTLFGTLGLLLALSGTCHAQQPNTLTPKELADGWILLFDGETTFGWGHERGNAGKALKVTDGVLDLSDLGDCRIFFHSVPFGSFEMKFDYQGDGNISFHVVNATGGSKEIRSRGLRFNVQSAWKTLNMQVKNGKAVFFFDDGQPTPSEEWTGLGTFEFLQDPKTKTKLRNIKLRPLETKSLFNGKDLTGWKEFPGKKSKFTVTDKGELNVKDGPGDLQTVGKYQNFVLQLDCISLGKHLNSGIFFRCRENEYQNGYEAQIRNQFTAQPTQDYVVEEYDPKTHELLAKKKIKSTAVDYGTGAIYRRQPARKEMSKDNEWFAMTIVAHGNHLATWVNGVQVTDWNDNRPKSDNARNGCKLEAGHISIQGHDPTTNLSFRNLRIAEMPASK